MIETARERVRRSVQRDRRFELWMDRMSCRLWPWRDAWLAAAISVIALLNYLSTYALLSLSNKPYAYERGPLAHWPTGRWRRAGSMVSLRWMPWA
jgi:hypothetical protein